MRIQEFNYSNNRAAKKGRGTTKGIRDDSETERRGCSEKEAGGWRRTCESN